MRYFVYVLIFAVSWASSLRAEFTGNNDPMSFIESSAVSAADTTVLGHFRFDFESGFFAGASNYQPHDQLGMKPSADSPFWRSFAGYRDSLGDNLGWHTGVSYYRSSEMQQQGQTELYGGLQYKLFTTRFSVGPGIPGKPALRTHLEAGMDVELTDGLGLGFHVGRFSDGIGEAGMTGYRLNVNKEVEGFGLGLNISNQGYMDEQQPLPGILDDTRFNFTVTKDF